MRSLAPLPGVFEVQGRQSVFTERVTVLDEICRCHDDRCHERHCCLRWTERETGGPRTPHTYSLYQGDGGWLPELARPRQEPCLERIPV